MIPTVASGNWHPTLYIESLVDVLLMACELMRRLYVLLAVWLNLN